MNGGNSESQKSRKLRIEDRKRARRESFRAAQEQSRSMTTDFRSAFALPDLFTAGTIMRSQHR